MNGLFILRQIDPQPDLAKALSDQNRLIEFQDGTYWIDEEKALDIDLGHEISGGTDQFGHSTGEGCTLGWGIFDADYNLQGKYRALDRAEKALQNAKVTVVADVNVDEDE